MVSERAPNAELVIKLTTFVHPSRVPASGGIEVYLDSIFAELKAKALVEYHKLVIQGELYGETVTEALLRVGAVVTHGEGDRLVRGGGCYIDDVRQDKASATIPDGAKVIRCGSRRAWSILTGEPIDLAGQPKAATT